MACSGGDILEFIEEIAFQPDIKICHCIWIENLNKYVIYRF